MDDTIHRSYEGFAYVYDTFMDNVPYEEWAEYVTGILEEYGITDGLVLDLGCRYGKHDGTSGRERLRICPALISPRICWKIAGQKKPQRSGHPLFTAGYERV